MKTQETKLHEARPALPQSAEREQEGPVIDDQLVDTTVYERTGQAGNPGGADPGETPPGWAGESAVMQRMEAAFEQDFSTVQLYKNSPKAAQLGLVGYAFGEEIHFGPSAWNPYTRNGRELLAHELAHVIQQRQGRAKGQSESRGGMYLNTDQNLESEAEQAGKTILSGQKITNVLKAAANAGPNKPVLQMTSLLPPDILAELEELLSEKAPTHENAIAAYYLLEKLNPEQLDYFYSAPEHSYLVARLNSSLPFQFLQNPQIGLEDGMDGAQITTLMLRLYQPETWQDANLLELIISILFQAGQGEVLEDTIYDILEPDLTDPESISHFYALNELIEAQMPLLKKYGIGPEKSVNTLSPNTQTTRHGKLAYLGQQKTYFGKKPKPRLRHRFFHTIGMIGVAPIFAQKAVIRGFHLPAYSLYQSDSKHIAGLQFGDEAKTGEAISAEEYEKWVEEIRPEKDQEIGPLTHLKRDQDRLIPKGFWQNRRLGDVWMEMDRGKKDYARVYARALPMNGIEYHDNQFLFRSGPGLINGLYLLMDWEEKNRRDDEIRGTLDLFVHDLTLENMRMVGANQTYGIGRITLKGLKLSSEQLFGSIKFGGAGTFLTKMFGTLTNNIMLLKALIMLLIDELTSNPDTRKERWEAEGSPLRGYVSSLLPQSFIDFTSNLQFDSLVIDNFLDTKSGLMRKISAGPGSIGLTNSNENGGLQYGQIKQLYKGLEKAEATKANTASKTKKKKKAQHAASIEQVKTLKEGFDFQLGGIPIHLPGLGEIAAANQSFDLNVDINNLKIDGSDYLDGIVNAQLQANATMLKEMMGLDLGALTIADSLLVERVQVNSQLSRKGLTGKDKEDIVLTKISIPTVKAEKLELTAGGLSIKGKDTQLKNLGLSLDIDLEEEPQAVLGQMKSLNSGPFSIEELSFEQVEVAGMGQTSILSGIGAGKRMKFVDILIDYQDPETRLTIGDWLVSAETRSNSGDYEVDSQITTSLLADQGQQFLDLTFNSETRKMSMDMLIPTLSITHFKFGDENAAKFLEIPASGQPILLENIHVGLDIDLGGEKPLSHQNLPDNFAGLLTEVTPTPLKINLRSLSIGQVSAMGFYAKFDSEVEEKSKGGKTSSYTSSSIITLPSDKKVFINNIRLSGLSLLAGDQLTLKPEENAQFSTGNLNFGGLKYAQTRNQVEKVLSASLNKFTAESIQVDLMTDEEGTAYTLKDYWKKIQTGSIKKVDFAGNVLYNFDKNDTQVSFAGGIQEITLAGDELSIKGIHLPSITADKIKLVGDGYEIRSNAKGKDVTQIQHLKADVKLILDRENVGVKEIIWEHLSIGEAQIFDLYASIEQKGKNGEKDTHIITFPKQKSFIKGLNIKGLRHYKGVNEKTKKPVWKHEIAKVSSQQLFVPDGFSYELAEKLRVELDYLKGDEMSFEWITGGYAWDLANLDTAGTAEKFGNSEEDPSYGRAGFKLDSEFINGSYVKDGDKTIITSDIDIPLIQADYVSYTGGDFSFNLPEHTEQPPQIRNLKGKMKVTITPPTKAEKKAKADAEALILQEYAASSKSPEDQLKKQKRLNALSAPSGYVFEFEQLTVEAIEGYGASIRTSSISLTEPEDQSKPNTQTTTFVDYQLKKNELLSVKNIALENFHLHMPKEGKMFYTGKANLSSINVPSEGLHIEQETSEISSRGFAFPGSTTEMNLIPIFKSGAVAFEGDSRGVFSLAVTSPEWGIMRQNEPTLRTPIMDLLIGPKRGALEDPLFSGIKAKQVTVEGSLEGDYTIILHQPEWDDGFVSGTILGSLFFDLELEGTLEDNIIIKVTNYPSGNTQYDITTGSSRLDIPINQIRLEDLQEFTRRLNQNSSPQPEPVEEEGYQERTLHRAMNLLENNWVTLDMIMQTAVRLKELEDDGSPIARRQQALLLVQTRTLLEQSFAVVEDEWDRNQMMEVFFTHIFNFRDLTFAKNAANFTPENFETYTEIRDDYFEAMSAAEWTNYIRGDLTLALFDRSEPEYFIDIALRTSLRPERGLQSGYINLTQLMLDIGAAFNTFYSNIRAINRVLGDLFVEWENGNLVLKAQEIQENSVMILAYGDDSDIYSENGQWFAQISNVMASAARFGAEEDMNRDAPLSGFLGILFGTLKGKIAGHIKGQTISKATEEFGEGIINPRVRYDGQIDIGRMNDDGVSHPFGGLDTPTVTIGALLEMPRNPANNNMGPRLTLDALDMPLGFTYSGTSKDPEGKGSSSYEVSGSRLTLSNLNLWSELMNYDPNDALNPLGDSQTQFIRVPGGHLSIEGFSFQLKTNKE